MFDGFCVKSSLSSQKKKETSLFLKIKKIEKVKINAKFGNKTIIEAKTLRKEMAKLYYETLYFSWTYQSSTYKYCSKYQIEAKKWMLSDQNFSTIFWSDYEKLEKNIKSRKDCQKLPKISPLINTLQVIPCIEVFPRLLKIFSQLYNLSKVMCTFNTTNISMIIWKNLLCPSVKMKCLHYLARILSN